ncbi:MAG: hypothetical protein QM500_12055 [Methylococcales bacterium]
MSEFIPDISPKNDNGERILREMSNYIPSDKERIILSKEKYKCKCCGFQSRPSKVVPSGYMETYKNIVLCRMCYGALHTDGKIDDNHNHGMIIYAPWISQSRLINLFRIAYLAHVRKNQTLIEQADRLAGEFSLLSSDLSKYDEKMSSGDLEYFSKIISKLPASTYDDRKHLLKGWRYLPYYAGYQNIMLYWDKASFSMLSDEKLENLLTSENP